MTIGYNPTFAIIAVILERSMTARAGNRRLWCLSALRAHTKAPYKTDLHRKTLRALNRPKAARAEGDGQDRVRGPPLHQQQHREGAGGDARPGEHGAAAEAQSVPAVDREEQEAEVHREDQRAQQVEGAEDRAQPRPLRRRRGRGARERAGLPGGPETALTFSRTV